MTGFAPPIPAGTAFAPHRYPEVVLCGDGPDGRPILAVGDGPLLATSGRQLAVRAVLDVNGYYAALGVPPGASRSQLARAYAELPPERRTPWLTEALKILMDPQRRAVYDRLAADERFVDSQVYASARREEALRKLKTGRIQVDESVYEDDADTPYWELRPTGRAARDPEDWGYAHYLWGCATGAGALSDWQGMMISALNEADAPPLRFAVGRRTPGTDTGALLIGGHPAAFLPADADPTPQRARQAAQAVRALAEA